MCAIYQNSFVVPTILINRYQFRILVVILTFYFFFFSVQQQFYQQITFAMFLLSFPS